MFKNNKTKPHTRIIFFTFAFILCLALLSRLNTNTNTLGDIDNLTPDYIIKKINQERQENQLDPLVENINLSNAAAAKAKNMIETGNFDHSYDTSSGRVEPWQFIIDEGYNYFLAGENLAKDFKDADTLTKAWMDSPGHRANILATDYKEIGVSVFTGPYFGKKDTTLVVTLFASPQSSASQGSSQSYSTTKLLLPNTTFIDTIASISPKYTTATTTMVLFLTLALLLDYSHHKKSTKPSIKHWKIK